MAHSDVYASLVPSNEKLRPYISYYYFHESENPRGKREFIFYPHVKNAITAYKGSDVSFTEKGSFVIPSEQDRLQILYTRKQKIPARVNIKGLFQKVGIIFQALGLNYFINVPLSEVSTASVVRFSALGEDFERLLDLVFAEPILEKKVDLLDAFFESRWLGFSEDRLVQAIELLFQEKGKISLSQLSEKLNASPKTVYRLFKKHLCCSVQEYRSLVRFRSALNVYEAYLKKPKLVKLAYEIDYYDQAEFVNHFKAITGYNPKKFLSGISQFGKQDTFWTVLE
ncbi:MAG: helix-turn-helix domain-containing protein [Bacteroidota bacterium]